MRLMLAVLCLVAVVAAQDPCLDVSYCVPAVHDIVQFPLSTAATPQQGITYVWNVFQAQTSQWAFEMYFGLATGDFFMLRNCHIIETTNSNWCGLAQAQIPGSSFVAYVRHSTYPDTRRQIFALQPNGVMGAYLGTEPNPYNTTGRPWYVQGNGWSPTYALFSGGGVAQAFSTSFPGGVAGADRTFREPCNACLMNSYAVPAVTALSQTAIKNFIGVTQWSAIPALMQSILSILQSGARGYAVSLYVGLSNNDYYEIIDCNNSNNAGPYCTAVAPARYVAGVRNDAVAPGGVTGSVVPFAMTEAGVMSNTPVTSAAYAFATSTRPWYLQGNGWTPSYQFITGNGNSLIGRSYTVAGYNLATANVVAVIGADTFTNEPCIGYVQPACP